MGLILCCILLITYCNRCYLMTCVRGSGGGGCWEFLDFPTPGDLIPMGHGIKRESYPLRNLIIPNEGTIKAPGTTRPVTLWFLDPGACCIGNYGISQWAWVHASLSNSVGREPLKSSWNGLSCIERSQWKVYLFPEITIYHL